MIESWKDIKKVIAYSKAGILSKEISKTNKLNLTLFCMAKNTEISEHTATKEGFVLVIEGNGIFNLEGEDIEMKPDILIKMNKNAVHSLKALENTSFLLCLFG